MCTYNVSALKSEAGGFGGHGQPRLHRETLSQVKKSHEKKVIFSFV